METEIKLKQKRGLLIFFGTILALALMVNFMTVGVHALTVVTNTGETYTYSSEDFGTDLESPAQEGTLIPDYAEILPDDGYFDNVVPVELPNLGSELPDDETIIGVDNRVRVNPTTQQPFQKIVQITATFRNGSRSYGTGSMVSADSVLTAAHVIYNRSLGEWPREVRVTPAMNGTSVTPYGSAYSKAFIVPNEWIIHGNYDYDIGMIKLDKPLGNTTGWFGMSVTAHNGMSVSTAGYPSDKPEYTMWRNSASVSFLTARRLYHVMDTFNGQSGSPIYNNQQQIVAVHNLGVYDRSYENSGVRINSDVYLWIDDESSSGLPIYRVYNPNSGTHFYTQSSTEVRSLELSGWRSEGVGWFSPTSGSDVYRLYNPNTGGHFFTTSVAERNNLVNAGWNYEGISWKASQGQDQKTPVFRIYNPNSTRGSSHLYTISTTERDSLVRSGWRYEGIAWYGL